MKRKLLKYINEQDINGIITIFNKKIKNKQIWTINLKYWNLYRCCYNINNQVPQVKNWYYEKEKQVYYYGLL